MTKTRFLAISLLVFTLLCGAFVFASCKNKEEDVETTPIVPEPVQLAAPTVVLTDNVATWSAIPMADKYEISIDDEKSYVENSVTSRKLVDGQTIKVRAIGDGVNYKSSDWSNSVTYQKPIPCYTVIWKNGDVVLEIDENVQYGAFPIYNGQEPTKPADTQYTYVFNGWSPSISVVTNDVTYEAKYMAVPIGYTIIWKSENTILETDTGVAYGSVPSYDGETPTKEATAQYTYTFSGWAPQISKVTESVTYQAQFIESVRKYTVTFYSEDGKTVLDAVTVEYGSKAVYPKELPVKNTTEAYTYEFENWVTEQGGNIVDDLTNVVADRSVYAAFREIVRTVTVHVVPNNAEYGSVSVSDLANVPYGSEIVVNGTTVTINGQTVTVTPAIATEQYTYTFVGWTADKTAGNTTTIVANFERSVNTYTITWKNGDTVLEVDERVSYGVTPVYNGKQPTREAGIGIEYVFSGWSPVISNVTTDITYIAQFISVDTHHLVVFYDEDGLIELGRTFVKYGESANYPNALPTKEATAQTIYTFDKWVTEKGGNIEATFDNITEDKVVYAKYTETVRKYVVTFCDYDGTILWQEDVPYGSPAQAPGNPERDGYRFAEWDKEYSNITGELMVKALYVRQFEVKFVDYNNSIIDIQFVDYNGNATAPQSPARNNYRFTGWNTGFTNILDDLTVKAEYVKQYKVIFLDYDGTVLQETLVDAGSAAVAPSDPTKEGYDFMGWDKTFTDVSSNLTVTATYRIKSYVVKFVMPDGAILGDPQIVEYGFSAIVPEYPEFFLEGAGDITKVYGFTRWDKSFNSVTEDLEIKAVYESDYTQPIIIIEFSQERNGDAKLYIYNHTSVTLNAIEFSINYKANVGNISVNSATINSASPFWIEDSDGNNNNQYVINNNESNFTFAWSDANGALLNGIPYNGCSKVITFNFAADLGGTVSKETFIIESCSAVVSDSNGENLEKITPVVVYR